MRPKFAAARALIFLAIGFSGAAVAQNYHPSFQPDRFDDRPAGSPNEVMVLASPHLSTLPDNFRPEMTQPLVNRLVKWHPTAVAVENSSGLLCDAMQRQPARYDEETLNSYCFDTTEAHQASGLDVPTANADVEKILANWPDDPTPQQRRKLALLFLAAGEPASATVQWLRLPQQERRAEGQLTDTLATFLDRQTSRKNEVDLIAAQVAAKSGLERVWNVDDQSYYAGDMLDNEAYGAALMKAWDNPATKARNAQSDALNANLGKADGLLDIYRAYNSPSYAIEAYHSDWGAALAEPSPEAFGRRYVAYWETRNLRMVANIREVLGRKPGTKLLAIVGASHKGYYEAYLNQMRDVKLVDVMQVLQ
ncbi:hypothetical protein GRI39_01655 [Altererythrobacter indicus]|uniref:TraB/GumN family protein n=1 Tax=Altericroceibacterium indicum TaxID=374177 RepID=A0A845A6T9_9SPHN|nr:hypothetical protein [Altericroceibacterium indicum]